MKILFRADWSYYNVHPSHIPLHVNPYPISSFSSLSLHSTHLSYSSSPSNFLTPSTQYYPLPSQSISTPSTSPTASAEVIPAPESWHSQFYTALIPDTAAPERNMPELYYNNWIVMRTEWTFTHLYILLQRFDECFIYFYFRNYETCGFFKILRK